MKELDSFTVERLEELSTKENIPEVAALARIALAAKRAEPVINIKFKDGWPVPESVGVVDAGKKLADGYHDFYTTPQLNSPEIPEGWKLVPIELTAEMAQAAGEAHEGESYLPYSIYRAMLAAAPEKPL
ncbi:hypothetical protein RSE69_004016 [Yersinia enterocolitica]|nr:hypothetical protein [Yersinia enterocolitica]ELI7993886.1 hypothetical protein [Yersinia enterocolitica]